MTIGKIVPLWIRPVSWLWMWSILMKLRDGKLAAYWIVAHCIIINPFLGPSDGVGQMLLKGRSVNQATLTIIHYSNYICNSKIIKKDNWYKVMIGLRFIKIYPMANSNKLNVDNCNISGHATYAININVMGIYLFHIFQCEISSLIILWRLFSLIFLSMNPMML